MTDNTPVVAFVGTSDAGKTTVVEGVVSELAGRGWRVATVKHSGHGFEIDVPGKDSHRHAQAGAALSMVSSPSRFAAIRHVEQELTLDEIAAVAADADILIAEGFKAQATHRIEVSRRERSETLVCAADEIVALVTDHASLPGVPAFSLDDARGIATFIEDEYLVREPA